MLINKAYSKLGSIFGRPFCGNPYVGIPADQIPHRLFFIGCMNSCGSCMGIMQELLGIALS